MCPASLHAPPPVLEGPLQLPLPWLLMVGVAVTYVLVYFGGRHERPSHRAAITWLHFLSAAAVIVGFLLLVAVVGPWLRTISAWYGVTLTHIVLQHCATAPVINAEEAASHVAYVAMGVSGFLILAGGILALVRSSLQWSASVAIEGEE